MYGSSSIRFSGIVSGMDTESIVKELMKAERIPLNKLKQKQQKLTWKMDAYRQWNTELHTFRNTTLFDMKLSKTYGTFNVSSDSSIVTGAATAEAVAGTHRLEVTKLAQSSSLVGTTNAGFDSAKSLGSQATNALSSDVQVTVEAKDSSGTTRTTTITIKTTDKIQDVVNALNTAKDSNGKSLGLQAMYDSNLKQFIVKTKDTGANTSVTLTGIVGFATAAKNTAESAVVATTDFTTAVTGADTIVLNGQSITLTNTKLLNGNGGNQTLDDIKAALQADIDAVYDGVAHGGKTFTVGDDGNGKLTITSSDTGPAATVDLTGTAVGTGDIANVLGFTADDSNGGAAAGDNIKQLFYNLGFSSDATLATTSTSYAGSGQQDAELKFTPSGGAQTTVTSASNTVSILGVSYTLKKTNSGAPIDITVSRDVDAEVENIKKFIEKYNELLDKLNKVVSEPVYRNYQPLLDEEREALSEKQIEQWEEKAKSGLLRRDSTLSTLINNMRLDMISPVKNGSLYSTLDSIGIKSTDYRDQGKLYINEDKLREALEKDPEAVKNLFIQNNGDKTEERGIIHRLYDRMADAFDQLTEKAGVTGNQYKDSSEYGEMWKDIEKRVYDWEDKLIEKENNYYRKFTAMEKAMSQYNAQSSWLMQQLGGLA